jgi:acyl carrier protein
MNAPDLHLITGELRGYVLREFLPGDPEESLRDDDLLLESGIIDSGSVISLAVFLEERFGIRVEDHEFVVQNFATIADTASFVANKLTAKCASY